MKNKLSNKLGKLNIITKIILIAFIVEAILVVISSIPSLEQFKQLTFGSSNTLWYMSPLIFALIMLCYSNYDRRMDIGIIEMTIALVINCLLYIVNGMSFNEAITYSGVELPLAIFGIAIMMIGSTIKQYKENKSSVAEQRKPKKLTLENLYGTAKHVRLLYKIMIYCTLFSLFVFVYNQNTYIQIITNPGLRTIVALQTLLPVFVLIGYITFTDITLPLLVAYNVIYTVASLLSLSYGEITIIQILNFIEFLIVVGYLVMQRIVKERVTTYNKLKGSN